MVRIIINFVIFVLSTDSVSRLIPREFEEIYVRIFCRHADQRALVDQAFEEVSSFLLFSCYI
jgi:hypothetical protein